jgi:hypothetical protein
MGLYQWLLFVHLLGVAVFLFAHGLAAGATLLLRSPTAGSVRPLLVASQRSALVANPALLVVIATGVWMGFAGSWWGNGWIWTAVAVLVIVIAAMFYVARPYYQAREALKETDAVVLERVSRTRPLLAAWIGTAGLVILIALMTFKPF